MAVTLSIPVNSSLIRGHVSKYLVLREEALSTLVPAKQYCFSQEAVYFRHLQAFRLVGCFNNHPPLIRAHGW